MNGVSRGFRAFQVPCRTVGALVDLDMAIATPMKAATKRPCLLVVLGITRLQRRASSRQRRHAALGNGARPNAGERHYVVGFVGGHNSSC